MAPLPAISVDSKKVCGATSFNASYQVKFPCPFFLNPALSSIGACPFCVIVSVANSSPYIPATLPITFPANPFPIILPKGAAKPTKATLLTASGIASHSPYFLA